MWYVTKQQLNNFNLLPNIVQRALTVYSWCIQGLISLVFALLHSLFPFINHYVIILTLDQLLHVQSTHMCSCCLVQWNQNWHNFNCVCACMWLKEEIRVNTVSVSDGLLNNFTPILHSCTQIDFFIKPWFISIIFQSPHWLRLNSTHLYLSFNPYHPSLRRSPSLFLISGSIPW